MQPLVWYEGWLDQPAELSPRRVARRVTRQRPYGRVRRNLGHALIRAGRALAPEAPRRAVTRSAR